MDVMNLNGGYGFYYSMFFSCFGKNFGLFFWVFNVPFLLAFFDPVCV